MPSERSTEGRFRRESENRQQPRDAVGRCRVIGWPESHPLATECGQENGARLGCVGDIDDLPGQPSRPHRFTSAGCPILPFPKNLGGSSSV